MTPAPVGPTPVVSSKDIYDVYAFLAIVLLAIAFYGMFSRLRGRKLTVLVVLEGSGDDQDIQKGALEAGNDLKIRVVFATPETFEEDIDQHNPESIVAFANIKPPKGISQRFFNGNGSLKQNIPADAFAAGYLAVVSARVNFMSEEFEKRENDEEDLKKSIASPFPGNF
jgi:hypothetical protein